LTASILAYSGRRKYADYKAHRTTNIWANREDLIAYEKALKFEAEIDELEANDLRAKSVGKSSPRDTPIETGAVGGNPNSLCLQSLR
jgi:Fanconi-associated nuclease 1